MCRFVLLPGVTFALILIIPSVLSTRSASMRQAQEMTVLSMGDSMTEGYIEGIVDTGKRYTSVLQKLLYGAEYTARVINEGKAGQMSTAGAMDLGHNLSSADPHVVTLLYGANDLLLEYGDGGKPRVSPHNFGEALRFMVREIYAESAVPILLSPVPVVPEKYYLRHDRELYGQYGGIEEHWRSYDTAVRRISEEEGVILVDLQRLLGDSLDITVGSDGAHPSAVGHEVIGNALFAVITGLELPGEDNGDTLDFGSIEDCFVYPNPYHLADGALLKIHVSVTAGGTLQVRIYDVSGKDIVGLPDINIDEPGEHLFVWDGTNRCGDVISPGVYLLNVYWISHADGGRENRVIKVAVLR